MSNNETVEVTMFKIKPDVDETELLQADEAFTAELQTMSGFISRELLKGENNHWIDIIHWKSLGDAQHSADTIASKPGAQPFIRLLEGDDNQMFHLSLVRTYQK